MFYSLTYDERSTISKYISTIGTACITCWHNWCSPFRTGRREPMRIVARHLLRRSAPWLSIWRIWSEKQFQPLHEYVCQRICVTSLLRNDGFQATI